MRLIFLGIDVGSTTVKGVVTDGAGRLLDHDYRYGRGQPARVLLAMLGDLARRWDLAQVAAAGITGSGSELLAPLLGALRVNELVAQTHALEAVFPQARTVVEMGGQDSKLLRLEQEDGHLRLADFAMNALCAAGTGAFLEQQAERLDLSLDQFSALALQARQPARVAGRCAVFAKSDLVHLQQQGIPLPDLVAGLCLAVARNLRATLGGGKPFRPPVVFQGGVARNAGMVWALEQVLGLGPSALLVPPHCTLMAALGAARVACVEPAPAFRGLEPLAGFVAERREQPSSLPRLRCPSPRPSPHGGKGAISPPWGEGIWLGLDVGSLSTKAVALDGEGRLLAGCYLPTAGQPLAVARRAVEQVMAQVGETVKVLGLGVTGSGRHLVGEDLGSDRVYNEITAQARAARAWDPEADTVLEIGGQDSKYIALRDGFVVDQVLNKACAAGTGAFLEEQAVRLGLPVEELGSLALTAAAPADLGERCTVFMESDLVHHQQQGARREDLAAGLAYAVARNYLARVVAGRPVGRRVLFQGGVALNPAVVAAFEALLARPIGVPPHPELSGAMGAALLAREGAGGRRQGAGSRKQEAGSRKQEAGGRRQEAGSRKADGPDLFGEREALLLRCLDGQPTGQGRSRVGFPRVLAFYDLLPYWGRFFRELGWEVVLSPPTTPELLARSAAEAGAETCFPVKLACGHALWLLEQGVERIFLPGIVNRADPLPGHGQSYHCPWIQAAPHLVEAALRQAGRTVSLLRPAVHFLWPGVAARELRTFARELGVPAHKAAAARRAAQAEQRRFEADLRRRGAEVLAALEPGQVAVVLVGRAYSTADPGLNADLPARLRRLGVLAVPLDCLPLADGDITALVSNMFWHSGQRILAAARIIRDDPRLQAVYLTHFGCGPDSFLLSFFREAMEGKPFLELELDDHSGDAGLFTRLEAFLESCKKQEAGGRRQEAGGRRQEAGGKRQEAAPNLQSPISNLLIPNVCDPAQVLAAAMRAYGLPAEVLPPSSSETLALGRELCLGRECLPCHTLVGDIVQRARRPGFEPAGTAYLVPTSAGPCRLGQFHDLLRQVLRRQGLGDLRVVAPSAENGYQYDGLGAPPLLVGRLAWQGLVAINLLEKLLHHHRPYEREAGSADRLYQELLQAIVEAVEAGGGRRVAAVVEEAVRRFDLLAVDRSRERPVIGLVGELYLRLNPFTNQQIIRRVEALGGEVWLAPMSEWIYYANHFSRFSAAAGHRYGNLLRLHLIRRVLDSDERRLLAALDGGLPNTREPSTARLLAAASPYFHPVLRTEAPLTLGKAIDFARQGLDGILNVMPFTCMPGTVVAGLAGCIRADNGHIPWLDVSFDGLGETNQHTRLEAFLHQAGQFRHRRSDGWGRLNR